MSNNSDIELIALVGARVLAVEDGLATLARQPGPKGDKGDAGDSVKGDKGDRGPQGKIGLPGKEGKPGQEGKPGPRGLDGKPGPKGDRGPKGDKGDKGDQGNQGRIGPMPQHQWVDGTKLRFEQAPGKWGELVELRGPAGRGGGGQFLVAGGTGGTTPNPWNPDDLPDATDDLPEQFIVRQNGIWVRATYEQMATWLGGSGPPPGSVTVNGGLITVNGVTVTVT